MTQSSVTDSIGHLEIIIELVNLAQANVRGHTRESFFADRDVIDLTAYRLAMIGEYSSRLPQECRDRYNLPWGDMLGTRNIVCHDWYGLDYDIIWDTARNDLDDIAAMAKAELHYLAADGRESDVDDG